MNTVQLLQSGFPRRAHRLRPAGICAPGFLPARRGWLPRFGWILLRYVLPPVVLVAVVSWCLLRR